MKYLKTFETLTKSYKLSSKFSDIFTKYKWVELPIEARNVLKKEIWELVDIAYKPLGGHVRISDPNSVINDKELSFWSAVDIDDDPYSDVVIFARKSPNGYKISGWGHDGEKESRKELIKQLGNILMRQSFWIEVSGRPAEILMNTPGINYLKDKESVAKLFPESEINWVGNGYYTRKLHDGTVTDEEIVIGNPRIN